VDKFIHGGSIISFGEHRFYVDVPEPLPDDVTSVFDPLFDEDSCCRDSFDLQAMSKVLMARVEDGGTSHARCAHRSSVSRRRRPAHPSRHQRTP
jgi:hypothetical protein